MDENTNVKEMVIEEKPTINENMCYLYAVKKDTIKMTLTKNKDSIYGDMHYNFFEKDGSFGVFNGTMKGDTIIGIYDFEAEGTKSKREMVFLRSGNSIMEGYGDMVRDGNTEIFKDNIIFQFQDGVVLNEVVCMENMQ